MEVLARLAAALTGEEPVTQAQTTTDLMQEMALMEAEAEAHIPQALVQPVDLALVALVSFMWSNFSNESTYF
tara:strand:+ start:130 stop:345 length:216 start_codon:yes stop_codon:yes gene_type:complete